MTKPHKTLSQAIIMNSYWGKVPRVDTEFIFSDGSTGTSQLANKTKDGATTKRLDNPFLASFAVDFFYGN